MIVFTTVFFSRKYLSSLVAYCRGGGRGGRVGEECVYYLSLTRKSENKFIDPLTPKGD